MKIIGSLIYTIVLFIHCSFLSILKIYIVQVSAQMKKMVQAETHNLFNGMNEGLIIISAVDKSISFASAPAVKLLKRLPCGQSQMDSGDDSI